MIQNYIKLVVFNNHFSKNINIVEVTLHPTLEFVSFLGSGTIIDDHHVCYQTVFFPYNVYTFYLKMLWNILFN